MTKKILIAIAILTGVFAFTFVSCNDDEKDNENKNNPSVRMISYVPCENHNENKTESNEITNWTVNGNVLTVNNYNILWNCCADTIIATSSINNDTIKILENANGWNACDCVCGVDYSYQIAGIPSGNYAVAIYTIDDRNEPRKVFNIQIQ